jgi:vacuolar-type H+-ATPase subunit E/Vma4
MSIEAILSQIMNDVDGQRNIILKQANQQKEEILRQARQDADKIYREIIDREKTEIEAEKQKLIVNARLEAKKQLLAAKQRLIDDAFARLKSELKKDAFKKKQISQDGVKEVPEDINFYLSKIRPEYEAKLAEILFDEK